MIAQLERPDTTLSDTMFTLSRVGDIAVVSLTCPAIREHQAHVLGRYLQELCDDVTGRVVLEVTGVAQFSCAWINTLLSLTHRCRAMGGNLVILGMPAQDERMLRSTGLDKHLYLRPSRSAAFAEFGTPSLAPWRLALARLLDIPVEPGQRRAA